LQAVTCEGLVGTKESRQALGQVFSPQCLTWPLAWLWEGN
jgi:hypothetical protein